MLILRRDTYHLGLVQMPKKHIVSCWSIFGGETLAKLQNTAPGDVKPNQFIGKVSTSLGLLLGMVDISRELDRYSAIPIVEGRHLSRVRGSLSPSRISDSLGDTLTPCGILSCLVGYPYASIPCGPPNHLAGTPGYLRELRPPGGNSESLAETQHRVQIVPTSGIWMLSFILKWCPISSGIGGDIE